MLLESLWSAQDPNADFLDEAVAGSPDGTHRVHGVQWEALIHRVGPILGFLVCITLIAELADAIGIFRVLAWTAARIARGSVLGLWLLVVAVAALSSTVLSLDTTAVLFTPVAIIVARQLGLDLGLFVYTTVWLANTASLLLPVSNLTNLLAMSRLFRSATPAEKTPQYAGLMWPAAAAAFVITVGMLAVIFRTSLVGRYQLPDRPVLADRPLFWLAAIVCAGLGPAFATGANIFVTAAAGAMLLVVGCVVRYRSLLNWRLLPWRLVLGVAALFVLVQSARTADWDRLLAGIAGTGESGTHLLQLSAVAAGGANLVNNLPAYLALEPLADSPLRMAVLLVGVNAGPLILPWGSLATLLWAARCRSAGVKINWARFARRGIVLVCATLLASVGVLLVANAGG